MAKFYLPGPGQAPSMKAGITRRANIPKEPYKVYGRPPELGQINAKVQTQDIEHTIPSLMQKELPAEVSRGLVQGVQETGAAQAAAGRASGEAAMAWGAAGVDLAKTFTAFTDVAVQLQKSKDAADESRVDNAWRATNDAFDERVAGEHLNSMEAMKLWPEYEQKVRSQIDGMNLSAHVRDSKFPDLNHNLSRKRTDLQYRMRDEQIKSDTLSFDTAIAGDLNEGKIESAVARIEKMYDAKLINSGQREKRIADAKIGYDEYRADRDITANPRAALADLETSAITGKSETYKNLPPGRIVDLRNHAREEVEGKERKALNTIENLVAEGKLKTPDDIDNVAAGNVEARKLDTLKKYVSQPRDPEYSQESMAHIETAIDTYTKEAPGTGSPEYYKIKEMIYNTAPKKEWGDLTSRLDKKRDEDKNALPGEDWFNKIIKDVEQSADDGAFAKVTAPSYMAGVKVPFTGGKPALDMTLVNKGDTDPTARKYRLEHKDEIEAMYKDARSIQIQLREWRKEHPGNNHKTQDEAYKYRNELLSTHGADAGRAPIRKAITVPDRPYTMGTSGPTTSSLAPTIRQQREEIMSELDHDPATKRLAMQMLDTEGGGVATMEALVNRVALIREKVPGWTIKDELNSGFYGPINRGYAQTLELHPKTVARYQQDIDEVRAGSNVIRGRTDQGSGKDPNVGGPGRVHVAGNPKEVYNYWTGRRRGIQFSRADAARHASSYG